MEIVIFSFNRALQLKALLYSLFKYVHCANMQIQVLYNTTNERFQDGYDILQNQFKEKVTFHKEKTKNYRFSFYELIDLYNLRLLYLCPFLRGGKTNFREQLLSLLCDKKGEVMFLTDDSVFVDDVFIHENDLQWLHESPWHRQLSLRIGGEFKTDDVTYVEKNTWKFSSYSSRCIWGYQFSLDAHIYDIYCMKEFLRCTTFKNPNTLESVGALHSGKKGKFEFGRHLGNVKILSYPINIVQKTFDNEALNADINTLNEYLLCGYNLVLPKPQVITDFQVYPDYVEVVKDAETLRLNIK